MPIYEYHCPSCGEKFEKLVRFGSDAPVHCPICAGNSPERLISAFAHTGAGAGASTPSYSSSSCATST
jgi:putative FmdB family regulatory protein